MKNIVILGSTGSIGTQTLDIVRAVPEKLHVSALAAGGSRPELLAEQVLEFQPQMVVVYEPDGLKALKTLLKGKAPEALQYRCGMEGLMEAAALPEAELVVTSLVGMIGIQPTVAAIEAGKNIALANKETLVCAGAYIMRLAKQKNVKILPVDSEHGAIFQCLQGVKTEDVHKIILTASGGPFRGMTAEQLKSVTLAQALAHPNWSMGAKITIDSATLMNKGLEMIEAMWLFDRKPEEIEPVIHPQSIIHSMVELKDGSVLAQMAAPDMRLPIEVALLYPERGPRAVPALDFQKQGALTFEPIDESVFPSTAMARYAMERGGLYPAVYNAANERAVEWFRLGRIGFSEIFRVVEQALEAYDRQENTQKEYTLEEVVQIRGWVEKRLS
ncbi:MAG: 1-deoxy-D-xylulose-5-phosphate reductoisomerase [Lachnospiraceae bacterium]|jgi:1-deoxy-D-xylulose-5-phosphate reductoisomerase|nr:1-deoxy-D-xylulose-5-phosphate reductoisomerase [Lachnospiraceae bacterium]